MHIMLDLETWGLRPDSRNRSIGAVAWDLGFLVDIHRLPSFYVNIDDNDTEQKYKFYRDPETVRWWGKPEQAEASKAFTYPTPISLQAAASLPITRIEFGKQGEEKHE